MADMLITRPYQPGDETKILAMFRQVFGRVMTEEYWYWRFATNPIREMMIDLIWDGEVLAGHYALSPVVLHTRTGERLTGLSMTTMTHPAYQGRGIFASLASSLYDRMARAGVGMVWGFPNIASHRGFARDLKWVDIYEIPTFRLSLTEGGRMSAAPAQVVPMDGFDARFDDLWQRVQASASILGRRDRAYLDWRYARNPVNRYSILGYVADERLMGYAIFKPYQDGLDVVDLLFDGNVVIGVDLVLAVAQCAAVLGCSSINTWLNVGHPLHLALEKVGFRNTEPITFFGGRLLTDALPAAEAYDFRRWYFTMGDSDVY